MIIVSFIYSFIYSFTHSFIVDWRRYNELRLQLDNYVFKAEQQLNELQRIGTTVTELEEQLEKHKVNILLFKE